MIYESIKLVQFVSYIKPKNLLLILFESFDFIKKKAGFDIHRIKIRRKKGDRKSGKNGYHSIVLLFSLTKDLFHKVPTEWTINFRCLLFLQIRKND